MNTLATLAAIETLLAERLKAREILDADIAALERTRSLLANVHDAAVNYDPSTRYPLSPAAMGLTVGPAAILPGTWHEAALRTFEDGRVHTTAEVYEAAKAAVGADLGYSAVASWLNRMAERGTIQKDGRGAFSRPLPQPHGQFGGDSDPPF